MSDALLTLYAATHLFSAIIAGFVGYWALFRTEMRSKRWFTVLVFSLSLWSLAATAGAVLSDRESQLVLKYLSLTIGTSVPLVWVVFTADYTYRSTRRNLLVRALAGVYALVVVTILTNPFYGTYAPLTVRETPFPHIEVGVGSGRILVVAYVLVSVALGTYYLASLFERGRSRVSRPTATLAGAVLLGSVPFLGTVLGFAPVETYDHTPFGISIFLLGVGYVVFWHGFYLSQRESPALSVSDECSDALSEPRSEQGHGKTGGLAAPENLRFSRTGVKRVRFVPRTKN